MKFKERINGVKKTIENAGQWFEEQQERVDRAEERAVEEGDWWYFLGPGGGIRAYYARKRLDKRKSSL